MFAKSGCASSPRTFHLSSKIISNLKFPYEQSFKLTYKIFCQMRLCFFSKSISLCRFLSAAGVSSLCQPAYMSHDHILLIFQHRVPSLLECMSHVSYSQNKKPVTRHTLETGTSHAPCFSDMNESRTTFW